MTKGLFLGNELKAALQARGMTGTQLADVLGVHASIVSLWTTNRRGIPLRRYAAIQPLLGDLQPGSPPVVCTSCAKVLKKTDARLRCRSCRMRQQWREGVFANKDARRGDRWTPEDVAELRAMAGSHTAKQIGKKIGRSRHAVHIRAHKLGIYIQTEDWTLSRLAQLFGTWQQTLYKAWLQTGLLPSRHLPPGDHCLRGEYRIREQDIETLILDCPWAYDASIMVPQTCRLARLAARVQRREPYLSSTAAAAYLGISRALLERWAAKGWVPHKRRHIGQGGRNGRLVFRLADLEAAQAQVAA